MIRSCATGWTYFHPYGLTRVVPFVKIWMEVRLELRRRKRVLAFRDPGNHGDAAIGHARRSGRLDR